LTSTLSHPTAVRSGHPDSPPRIGIVNLMPHAEEYERWLLPQLAAALPIEALWIRVDTRSYSRDAPDHIAATYHSYADIVGAAPLDGLIVSGAAVEHLPFEEVRFMPELEAIVRPAERAGTPILGLCWGALAVVHLLFGLPKNVYPTKVSGVYETLRVVEDGP